MRTMKQIGRIMFFTGAAFTLFCLFSVIVFGADAVPAIAESVGINPGLAYISAALSTGIAGIGGGMAVGAGAPAAIGALTEDPKSFGKALIFVALGEGIALYGMLVAILILNKV